MSLVNKRKHMIQAVMREPLAAPGERQRVVRVVSGRGNNLHEVEAPDGEHFLASMPTCFRRNLWIKRGDFVLLDPIDEGDKVKGEIALVLTGEHRRFYRQNGWWPAEFGLTETDGSSSSSSSDTDDDFGIPRNTNRPPQPSSSSSSFDEHEDEESEEEEDENDNGGDNDDNFNVVVDGDMSSSDASFASISSGNTSDASTESARIAQVAATCKQEE